MQRLLSPICLILCLALLVTAFAVLATDSPEPSVALHAARTLGDEARETLLQRQLQQQIWIRRALVSVLFLAAFATGVAGFCSIGDARR